MLAIAAILYDAFTMWEQSLSSEVGIWEPIENVKSQAHNRALELGPWEGGSAQCCLLLFSLEVVLKSIKVWQLISGNDGKKWLWAIGTKEEKRLRTEGSGSLRC